MDSDWPNKSKRISKRCQEMCNVYVMLEYNNASFLLANIFIIHKRNKSQITILLCPIAMGFLV